MPAADQETLKPEAVSSGAWLAQVRHSGFDDMVLWDVVVEGTESDWLTFLNVLRHAAKTQPDVVSAIAVTKDRDRLDGIPGETVRIRLSDGVVANARMFSDDEIEIDFDHRQLTAGNAGVVLFIMRLLGDTAGRPTRLASEGDHEIFALTYEPSSKQYRLHI